MVSAREGLSVTSPAKGVTRERAVAVSRRALVDAWFPKGSTADLAEWERIAELDACVVVDALSRLGVVDIADER